ncbi:hypothetical protein DPMN_111474 [Dreissena polymorpha]|uniref:Uncharacterized protein n=1 Tax=Dreissena polymorpha TaxID=45954 RepID=A0A9D4KEJ1_DREPO|nr:hypothetical protein DPMN_111474 [Dreissena polymorpha]
MIVQLTNVASREIKFHQVINVAARVINILTKLGLDIIGTNLLTKFHEDRKINVASGVLTRKNAPPPGSHVFQPTSIIFELIQDIIGINLLTKFHEDPTVNVASRTNLLTKFHEDWTINEKCPAPGGHVFKATKTIFKLIQDIIGTNLLTKFHDDRKINVTSRVLTRKIALPLWWPYIIGMNHLTEKNALPLGCHVIQANVTIFQIIQDIIKTNLLTKFHEDWTINVASSPYNEKCPTPWRPYWTINVASRVLTSRVFQPTGIIFELVQDIIGMNLLTKFHEDQTINGFSRLKNAPPLGSHVFQANVTIFELIQDIIKTNLLTKFHEDWTINVASRDSHVIQLTRTIFELNSCIKETNVLSKFYENWAKNVTSTVFTCFHYIHIEKNAPPTGGHVFSPIPTIFKLVRDIKTNNVLTNFHDDWAKIVTSRVFTRKTAPPTGGHVFHRIRTTFKLNQDIIKTNILTNDLVFDPAQPNFELGRDFIETKLLTKFHEDGTRNVASRVTDGRTYDGQRPVTKAQLSNQVR